MNKPPAFHSNDYMRNRLAGDVLARKEPSPDAAVVAAGLFAVAVSIDRMFDYFCAQFEKEEAKLAAAKDVASGQ